MAYDRLRHVVWLLLRSSLGFWLKRRFQIELVGFDREPKGSYLLLSNHCSTLDPWLLGAVSTTPISFLTQSESRRSLWVSRMLASLVGIIPKAKARPDPKALRQVFETMGRGSRAVGIFPEGERSWNGACLPPIDNIVRLVRALECPLRLCSIEGSYLARPRWAPRTYTYPIRLRFRTLDPAEIESLDEAALYRTIRDGMRSREPEERPAGYRGQTRGRRAEGIRYLLWLCPACRKQDGIHGEGPQIVCDHCHMRWDVDDYLNLLPGDGPFRHVKEWADWEAAEITGGAFRNRLFSEGVALHEKGRGAPLVRRSRLRAEDRWLYLEPEQGPARRLDGFGMRHIFEHFNQFLQFDYEKATYRLTFSGRNIRKWLTLLKHLETEARCNRAAGAKRREATAH